MKYIVTMKQVWIQKIEIDAVSEDDARKAVEDGKGKDIDGIAFFSYSLEPEYWDVVSVEE